MQQQLGSDTSWEEGGGNATNGRRHVGDYRMRDEVSMKDQPSQPLEIEPQKEGGEKTRGRVACGRGHSVPEPAFRN